MREPAEQTAIAELAWRAGRRQSADLRRSKHHEATHLPNAIPRGPNRLPGWSALESACDGDGAFCDLASDSRCRYVLSMAAGARIAALRKGQTRSRERSSGADNPKGNAPRAARLQLRRRAPAYRRPSRSPKRARRMVRKNQPRKASKSARDPSPPSNSVSRRSSWARLTSSGMRAAALSWSGYTRGKVPTPAPKGAKVKIARQVSPAMIQRSVFSDVLRREAGKDRHQTQASHQGNERQGQEGDEPQGPTTPPSCDLGAQDERDGRQNRNGAEYDCRARTGQRQAEE